MSPEQLRVQTPTAKEDIYGVGAMMMLLFTNLFPEKLGRTDLAYLETSMAFFIGDEVIARLIRQCLEPNPENRPSLAEIISHVRGYRNKLATQPYSEVFTFSPSDSHSITQAIQDGLLSLNSPVMKGLGKTWHSCPIRKTAEVANAQLGAAYYSGLYAGVAGVLYMLAQVKYSGMPISSETSESVSEGLEFIEQTFLSDLPNVPAGLYFGAAGVALSIKAGIERKLVLPSSSITKAISECLNLPVSGPDLATGVAGQGLAILQCITSLVDAKRRLQIIVGALQSAQQPDGSWISYNEKRTGFSYGVSGITLFLMKYYRQYGDESIKNTIEKALTWLQGMAVKRGKTLIWPVSDKNKSESLWLHEGQAGVALCFIRAYEAFKLTPYRKLAVAALDNIASYPVYSNLSLLAGMSGLGEVYLEAFRAFEEQEWFDRADWIADVLVHTGHAKENDHFFWVIENNQLVTADLMVGNGGVIHFLLRHTLPDKLRCPLGV